MILLLGGTAEARALHAELAGAGVPAVLSLAGATADAEDAAGAPGVRVGGFGGAAGLAEHLAGHGITAVVDATHPFAATISRNAAEACASTGVPLLRLERPSWSARDDAGSWRWVADLDAARRTAERRGSRPFLAVGRQSLRPFLGWTDRYALVRAVSPPDHALPASWELVTARGPFRIADEIALLRDRRIDVLVSKDAGGPTTAKLDAARRLGAVVVMVRRPDAPAGVPAVPTVAEAAAWCAAQVARRRSR